MHDVGAGGGDQLLVAFQAFGVREVRVGGCKPVRTAAQAVERSLRVGVKVHGEIDGGGEEAVGRQPEKSTKWVLGLGHAEVYCRQLRQRR